MARKGQLLVVVEMKRRRDVATALAVVTTRQQRRIARAAEAFMARNSGLGEFDARFDVIVALPVARQRV